MLYKTELTLVTDSESESETLGGGCGAETHICKILSLTL